MSKIVHTCTSNPTLFGDVITEFSYNPESPFELTMTFHADGNNPIVWNVSIETLLDAAANGRAGEGDIVVYRHDDGDYTIDLFSEFGSVSLTYDSIDINAFIIDVRARRGWDVKNWNPCTDEALKELFS